MGATTNVGHEAYGFEKPQHTVYVSAFYMDRFEVTKELWDDVYSWAIAHGYSFDNVGAGKASSHPVHSVGWYDAVKWCNARSQKEGLTPVYCTSTSKTAVYVSGQLDLSNDWVRWDDDGFRLPTEAEWEKAARGGVMGHRFPWTDSDEIQHARANYYSTNAYSYDTSPTRGMHPSYYSGSWPFSSPVGSFAGNGYGIYDMAGNLSELCWDWYSFNYYSSSPTNNPRGPENPVSGFSRVLRGGAYNDIAHSAGCGGRGVMAPDAVSDNGFRCVRSPPQTQYCGLAISGNTSIPEGSSHDYKCYAQFSNGTSNEVTKSSTTVWRLLPGAPAGTTNYGNTLVAGDVVTSRTVTLRATHTIGGVTKTGELAVTITPVLSVEVQITNRYEEMVAGVNIGFKALITGNTQPIDNIIWEFPGCGDHGPLTGSDTTWAWYGGSGTKVVHVMVVSGANSAHAYRYVPVRKVPVSNEPIDLPPAFDVLGDPTSGLVLDPAKRNNGLVVLVHGMYDSATNAWVVEMANAIAGRLSAAPPNVVRWNWELMADPDRFTGVGHPGRQWYDADDFLEIRPYACNQGQVLANWIREQVALNNIYTNRPIHIIGHSAGGFVGGECGYLRRNWISQVTMLDTPFAPSHHVFRYPNPGKVEQYISSIFGLDGLLITVNGPYRYGDASIWVRALLQSLNPVTNHTFAHQWYTSNTVMASEQNGFYYSPLMGHGFHSMMLSRMTDGERELQSAGGTPVSSFETFGNISLNGSVYTLTEDANAGIFKTVDLPACVTHLQFSYRFQSASTDDFIAVYWKTNPPVYIGLNLPLSRETDIEAIAPLDQFAGETGRLVIQLVSRGSADTAVTVQDIELVVDTQDTDGDGASDCEEGFAGTDAGDSNSVFAVTEVSRANTDQTLVRWSSESNKVYQLWRSTNSLLGYSVVCAGLLGNPPVNTCTDTFVGIGPVSYGISVACANDPSRYMVLIPAGPFVMGNATNVFPWDEGWLDEMPQHTVHVSAFYMDVCEVTKALWDEVKAYNGGNGYTYSNPGSGKAANHPVHSVNWFDVVKWCNARSQRDGLTPVYYTDGGFTTVYKTGEMIEPYANWAANGYRLPTEAEWEKAARGGAADTRFAWTDYTNKTSHAKANYFGNEGYSYDLSSGYHPTFATGEEPYTSPVGYFAPNGYGLYDMAGNVMELCWDWWGDSYYDSSPDTDPRGPGFPGLFGDDACRMRRGGSWDNNPYYQRVSVRVASNPDLEASQIGFRCVRSAE